MRPGLYKASFSTPLDEGAGVVTITESRIQGGDSSYWYSGSYSSDGRRIQARLKVRHHSSFLSSVFGPLRDFDLILQGDDGGSTAFLKGQTPQMAGVSITIRLGLLEAQNVAG